jgi:hypothetical protein
MLARVIFLTLVSGCLGIASERGETMKCYADFTCDGAEQHDYEEACFDYEDLPARTKDYRARLLEETEARCTDVHITMLNCETDSPFGPNGKGRPCTI